MVIAEVKFAVEFNEDTMPSSYTSNDYLIEVLQEAITDAMYDVGAGLVSVPSVEIDNT